jgi:hypothetical protein
VRSNSLDRDRDARRFSPSSRARLTRHDRGRFDVVVSCHACGALTGRILERASSAGARIAVLPCRHDEATCDSGDLTGWMP